MPSAQPSSQPSLSFNTTNYRIEYAQGIESIVILANNASTNRTQITASVTVEYFGGFVFCGAYLTSQPIIFNASEQIGGRNPSKLLAKNPTDYVMTNLMPDTNYTIYCTTQSLKMRYLPLSEAIKHHVDTATACCRHVSVSMAPQVVFEHKSLLNGIRIAVEFAPTNSLNVQLAWLDVSGNSLAVAPLVFPDQFAFDPASALQVASTVVGNTIGNYSLQVVLSGSSASEYSVNFESPEMLSVISSNAEPPTPVLLDARFSSDGRYVEVTFDTQTNAAGYTNVFPCHALFSFDTINISTCMIASPSAIRIFQTVQPFETQYLDVFSKLVLLPTTSLRAFCVNGNVSFCDTWRTVAGATVFVQDPLVLQPPIVVVSAPSDITACQSLTLDITGSTGGAGREWLLVEFTVARISSATGDWELSQFLKSREYGYSPPTPIPAYLLAKGVQYAFKVRLCNFLLACNTFTKVVRVSTDVSSAPVLATVGNAIRSIIRNQELVIQASAYTQTCTGLVEFTNLQYEWAVSLLATSRPTSQNVSAIRSTSQNPTIFRLPPYALMAGTSYAVIATVSSLTYGTVAKARVNVMLQFGTVVAVIQGGARKVIQTNISALISASGSYDQDIPVLRGEAAGLQFEWTCVQTAPKFVRNCSETLLLQGNSSQDLLVMPVGYEAVGTVSRLTVVVSSGTRASSAYTDVLVTTDDVSEISILTAADTLTAFSTSRRLQLQARLTLVTACAANWTVNDRTIALPQIALTPVAQFIYSGTGITFNLVLAANALPQRSVLVFSLQCGISVASITVTTNGAPQPGRFTITPANGTELVTTFTFSAAEWVDTDLPITYEFGFLSPSADSFLIAQGKSQVTYYSSTLAAGPEANGHLVNSSLSVFDQFDAMVTIFSMVKVESLDAAQQVTALNNVLALVNTSTLDGKRSVLAVSSTVLNRVNCTLAPDCAALRRDSCLRSDHTCGKCLEGFYGDDGNRNTQCIPVPTVPGNISRCTSDAQCLEGLQKCDRFTHRCYYLDKQCDLGCSGNGLCFYSSISTGLRVGACKIDDFTCKTTCECAAGFSGSGCQYPEADLLTRRALRSALVETMLTVVKTDDITTTSLCSWSAYLYSVANNPYELSAADAQAVQDVAASTATYAALLGADYLQLGGILQAVDAVMSVGSTDYSSETMLPNNSAVMVIDTLSTFVDLISQSQVYGQTETTYLYSNFRLVSSVLNTNSSADTHIPQSAIETETKHNQTSLSIQSLTSTGAIVRATIVQLHMKAFTKDPKAFYSDPIRVTLKDEDDRAAGTERNLTFSIRNNDAVPYFIFGEETGSNFTTICRFLSHKNHSFVCPYTGAVIWNNCTGDGGTLVSYCPEIRPSCNRLNVSSALTNDVSNCVLLNHTDTMTTCRCAVTVPSNRRRLAVADDLLDDAGVMDLAAASQFVAMDFQDTFHSASAISPTDVTSKARVIIGLFCCLWGSGAILLVSIHVRETEAAKKAEALENARDPRVQTGKIDRLIAAYINIIIPAVYNSSEGLSMRLWREMTLHHRYFHLFVADTRRADLYDRSYRTMRILTIETLSIFLQAVLFDLQRPVDDGSCRTFFSKEDCLSRPTVLDSSISYCSWEHTSDNAFAANEGYTCEYDGGNFSRQALISVIIITTILTAALKLPIDMLLKLWICPVQAKRSAVDIAEKYADHGQQDADLDQQLDTEGQAHAVSGRSIPKGIHQAHALVSSNMQQLKPTSKWNRIKDKRVELDVVAQLTSKQKKKHPVFANKRHTNKLAVAVGAAVGAEDGFSSLEEEESAPVHLLCKDALTLRLLFDPDLLETRMYDSQWGIDSDADLRALYDEGHAHAAFAPQALRTISQALSDTQTDVIARSPLFSSYNAANAGLELMHLFVIDLLGRTTRSAAIFRNKFNQDFEHLHVISMYVKYAAIALIVLLNAFFVYFVLLKGMSKGYQWQWQFLQIVLIQFFMEVCLFETVECLWLHYVVPESVRMDVEKAVAVLQELAKKVTAARPTVADIEDRGFRQKFFNAPNYLFVSNHLAQSRPDLLESRIVLTYHNHFPGMICRTFPHFQHALRLQKYAAAAQRARPKAKAEDAYAVYQPALDAYAEGAVLWAVLRGLAAGVVYALQALGVLPFILQKPIVRLIQASVVSLLMLLWYSALANALYFLLFVLVLLAIAACFLLRYLHKQHEEGKQIQPMRPHLLDRPIGRKERWPEPMEGAEQEHGHGQSIASSSLLSSSAAAAANKVFAFVGDKDDDDTHRKEEHKDADATAGAPMDRSSREGGARDKVGALRMAMAAQSVLSDEERTVQEDARKHKSLSKLQLQLQQRKDKRQSPLLLLPAARSAAPVPVAVAAAASDPIADIAAAHKAAVTMKKLEEQVAKRREKRLKMSSVLPAPADMVSQPSVQEEPVKSAVLSKPVPASYQAAHKPGAPSLAAMLAWQKPSAAPAAGPSVGGPAAAPAPVVAAAAGSAPVNDFFVFDDWDAESAPAAAAAGNKPSSSSRSPAVKKGMPAKRSRGLFDLEDDDMDGVVIIDTEAQLQQLIAEVSPKARAPAAGSGGGGGSGVLSRASRPAQQPRAAHVPVAAATAPARPAAYRYAGGRGSPQNMSVVSDLTL